MWGRGRTTNSVAAGRAVISGRGMIDRGFEKVFTDCCANSKKLRQQVGKLSCKYPTLQKGISNKKRQVFRDNGNIRFYWPKLVSFRAHFLWFVQFLLPSLYAFNRTSFAEKYQLICLICSPPLYLSDLSRMTSNF